MKENLVIDVEFFTSNDMAPTLEPPSKTGLYRDNCLISQLSFDKLQFKSHITTLYMVSTPYNFHLNPNRYNDLHIRYASKQLDPF